MKPIFSCTYSLSELKQFAMCVYYYLKKENIKLVYLRGDVGSGKTTFVKTLIETLESSYNVTSPTYNYVNEYIVGDNYIWHFDLYRIEEKDDLIDLGIVDYLHRQDGIAFVEWPEKLEQKDNSFSTLVLQFYHLENDSQRSCIVSLLQ